MFTSSLSKPRYSWWIWFVGGQWGTGGSSQYLYNSTCGWGTHHPCPGDFRAMDYRRGKGMCNEYFQPGFTIPAADGASISNGQNIFYFIFKQRSAGGEKKLRAGETISHPIIFSQDLQFLTADGASIEWWVDERFTFAKKHLGVGLPEKKLDEMIEGTILVWRCILWTCSYAIQERY